MQDWRNVSCSVRGGVRNSSIVPTVLYHHSSAWSCSDASENICQSQRCKVVPWIPAAPWLPDCSHPHYCCRRGHLEQQIARWGSSSVMNCARAQGRRTQCGKLCRCLALSTSLRNLGFLCCVILADHKLKAATICSIHDPGCLRVPSRPFCRCCVDRSNRWRVWRHIKFGLAERRRRNWRHCIG